MQNNKIYYKMLCSTVQIFIEYNGTVLWLSSCKLLDVTMYKILRGLEIKNEWKRKMGHHVCGHTSCNLYKAQHQVGDIVQVGACLAHEESRS